MISRKLLSLICAAFALLWLDGLSADSRDAANDDDPVRMRVDYGQGRQKRRRSHHGEMEPISLRPGQVVTITLEFPRNRSGEPVIVAPIDGGRVAPEGSVALAADGTIDFNFQAGRTAGLYRLMVNGADEHLLSFYVVDPDRPGNGRGGNR